MRSHKVGHLQAINWLLRAIKRLFGVALGLSARPRPIFSKVITLPSLSRGFARSSAGSEEKRTFRRPSRIQWQPDASTNILYVIQNNIIYINICT